MKLAALLVVVLLLLWLPSKWSNLTRGQRNRTGKFIFGATLIVIPMLVFRVFGPWGALAAAALLSLLGRGAIQTRKATRSSPDTGGGRPPQPASNRGMSYEEACAVLGVAPGAQREEILRRYRALMKKVHPDTPDGSEYLATRINTAKDTLLPR